MMCRGRRITPGVSMGVLISIVFGLSVCAIPAKSQEWHPEEPAKGEKDWVQLTSGEWIRGNIDLFRDLKMEFDSDELDDLKLDWEDIAAFRAPRNMTFVFTGQRVIFGPATMRDGVIRISTSDGIREFRRRELLSIIEGTPKEINFWSAKVKLGLTARTGNTNQTDLSTSLMIKREATRSRFTLDYRGDFSEVSDEQTVNSHKGTLLFDLFISRMLYVTPFSYEYYSDKFKNIDYRSTIGAGFGYFFFRQSRIDWSVGLGGGYQVTTHLSVEEGEDTVDRTGSLIPTTKLETDITKDIELEIEYRSMIGIPDPKSSTHHASGSISIDFYKDIFELTFSIVWDRVDNPKAYEDGTVPEKDDLKMVFGFGIDL